jgi:anaerobic magnesium-protoporphyrin IX monomethyl ester cyclase
VVIGGTLTTRFVERLTRLPEFFDLFANGVVAFEGETALAELLTQLQGARDFSKVPNYLYCTPSGVRLNRIHVEDLARLPTPDFEGLPLKQLRPAGSAR